MLKLFDARAPNPNVVRHFIFERRGLDVEVQPVDLRTLENRKLAYRTNVNPRGELPALKIDDKTVLTEITAICEYLDEVAKGGKSLFGETALERAETRMWLRRMDLEVAQPLLAWFRNDPATVDFFQGHRLPTPEARLNQKIGINQCLSRLDEELEGKSFLCGERFSAADVHFYGLVKPISKQAEWVLSPARKNVAAYFQRIDARNGTREAVSANGTQIST